MKERSSANVIRIIYMILTILFLASSLTFILFRMSATRASFWKQMLVKSGFNDYVMDEVDDIDVPEFLEDTGFDYDEFKEEFVDFALDEGLEAVIEGDTEIDEDRFEDILEDYVEEYITDLGATKEQYEDFEDELYELCEDYVDDMSNTLEEADLDFEETFKVLDLYCIGSAVVCGILLVIALIISRNKFLPIKATGIAAIVGSVVNLGIVFGLKALFQVAAQEADTDDDIAEVVVDFLDNVLNHYLLQLVIIFFCALAVTIVFSILAKSKARSMAAEIDETSAEFDSSNYTSGVETSFNPVSNYESSSDNTDRYSEDDLE